MMNKRSEGDVLNRDIIEQEILARLPAKSLLRFRCVCKRWRSLISNDPIFIRQHSQKLKASPGLVYWGIEGLTFLSIDQTPFEKTLIMRYFYPHISATCNGLICYTNALYEIWLCNPATKEKASISNPSRERFFGLAFDPYCPTPRYHIVRPYISFHRITNSTHHFSIHVKHGFDVFSSDTRVWRKSKEKVRLPNDSLAINRSVFVDGVLYFKGKGAVLWFNPEKDLAGFTLLPTDHIIKEIARDEITMDAIGEWEGRLSYIRTTDSEIDIWVFSYSQWRKKYCVNLERMVEDNVAVFAPICHMTINFRSWKAAGLCILPLPFNGGDIIFFWLGGRIFFYNIKTGEASEFCQSVFYEPLDYMPYINSLVALPKQGSG